MNYEKNKKMSKKNFNIYHYFIKGILLLVITAILVIITWGIRHSILGRVTEDYIGGGTLRINISKDFLYGFEDDAYMVCGDGEFQEGDKIWVLCPGGAVNLSDPPKVTPYFIVRFYPHPMVCLNP